MLKLASGKEVDFIEGDAALDDATALIQVCLDLGRESTRKREVSALQEAMARFGKAEAAIITLEEEGEVPVPEGLIRITPAWKWLLEP